MTTIIELDKYTVLHDNGANLRALRHGEPWRDLCGDNLIMALIQRIEELEEEVDMLQQIAWEDDMKNKRYYIFAGQYYYPSGGMGDHIGSVDKLDEIQAFINNYPEKPYQGWDWAHTLDIITGEYVDKWKGKPKDL
jgi:hypothetical protein